MMKISTAAAAIVTLGSVLLVGLGPASAVTAAAHTPTATASAGVPVATTKSVDNVMMTVVNTTKKSDGGGRGFGEVGFLTGQPRLDEFSHAGPASGRSVVHANLYQPHQHKSFPDMSYQSMFMFGPWEGSGSPELASNYEKHVAWFGLRTDGQFVIRVQDGGGYRDILAGKSARFETGTDAEMEISLINTRSDGGQLFVNAQVHMHADTSA